MVKVAVEYVGRCGRCNRLIKRGREVRIDNVLYGQNCAQLAMSAVRNAEPWVEGRPRP